MRAAMSNVVAAFPMMCGEKRLAGLEQPMIKRQRVGESPAEIRAEQAAEDAAWEEALRGSRDRRGDPPRGLYACVFF